MPLLRLLTFYVLRFSFSALAAEPHHLVDNFTTALPSSPSVSCETDFEHAKVGLAAARVTYRFEANRTSASLNLPDEARGIAGPGVLKLWVKGDGSATEMQLLLRHAEVQTDKRGERRLTGHTHLPLPRLKLDFTEWREIALDARQLPANRVAWWDRLDFYGQPPRKPAGEAPPPRVEGTVWLDDLRLYPAAAPPAATMAVSLIGPPVRSLAKDIAVSLDVRSFVRDAARLRARVTMTDRNENLVADRDFHLSVAPGASQEHRLDLAPERLEAYLPPFTIDADVLSSDLPQLSGKSSLKLVMGNGLMLFDDFSDVLGRWFTAGYSGDLRTEVRTWVSWTMGEAQRANPWAQTSATLSRALAPGGVEAWKRGSVEARGQEGGADGGSHALTLSRSHALTLGLAPGRYALKLDFAGDAAVYSARERHLPGNPFRLGVWVKGDGSGARLFALILDYTDAGDFWEGGWKRTYEGERELCTLDFTDWRYVEVPLPGNGLGSNTPRGSTPDIDYPLELTAFRVSPAKPGGQGTVLLGPILVHTQQPAAQSLSVHIGYDDAEGLFAPDRGAWATVQNGWVVGARKVKAHWTLADRSGDVVAKGQADLELGAGAARGFRIDLPKHAAEIAKRLAPFRLQVTAADAEDGSVSATREIALARPDSNVFLADFESDRGYLALRALHIERPVPVGEPVARTLLKQAPGDDVGLGEGHGSGVARVAGRGARTGRRSLALPWTKPNEEAVKARRNPWMESSRPTIAAIDPALPGVPVELSLWVHGDGSGVLFYPIIGDTVGVRHGAHLRQFDLFLTRSMLDPRPSTTPPSSPPPSTLDPRPSTLQNAVRVDWTGWKELRFRLPVVPPTWDQKLPILGFTPSYPLGLHLAVDPAGAAAERGTIYVDDIAVRTHLEPDQRLGLSLVRSDETNVIPPDGEVRVRAANHDVASPRKARLAGGLFDWRGSPVAGLDQAVELRPGEQRELALAKAPGPGAYALRIRLTEGGRTLATLEEDVLAADLKPLLGEDWRTALRDDWKLRAPIRDRYTFLDEDWDWVEHQPGNLQLDTIRERAQRVRARGADPYVLLGYSAYWAAGVGLEQLKAGAFVRAARDAGHAVNTFLVPERPEDWDDYVCELMRGVGREVAGWVLWNNPDSGPVAVEPKRFAEMIRAADQWRRVYCPETPLLIGGMSRTTAIPYLKDLAKLGALDHITGINVRLDVGRLSPEDALVPAYVRDLRVALGGRKALSVERKAQEAKDPPRSTLHAPRSTILLTDLDWAVEKGEGGLDAFDQAAYLVRSDLLLGRYGIRPALAISNGDFARLGLGLVYRRELLIPPRTEKPVTCQFKPAWWGIARTRQWLDQLKALGEVEVQDVIPGRTRCLLYERVSTGSTRPEPAEGADQGRGASGGSEKTPTRDRPPPPRPSTLDPRPRSQAVAIVWRNNDPGGLSFAQTGLAVEAAEDIFGSPVPVVRRTADWYSIGKVPTIFTLGGAKVPAPVQALARLWVCDREGEAPAEPSWPQRVLAAFTPEAGQRHAYAQTGGEPAALAGLSVTGEPLEWPGLRFPKGGTEGFTVDAPAGADLILRKRYLLDEAGHEAEVLVNGQAAGKWNLRRSEKELSGGPREALFFIDRKHLAGKPQATVEIRCAGPANSAGWVVLEYRGGDFPLSALGPIHADQNVAHLRLARNIVGAPLAVGKTPFANGLGVFARSLIEYPLNGQFSRFSAKVGVDAATEGRGTVVFEVHADGRKLWSSGILSGLDEAREVSADLRGADRLRLIVTDAGDGNRFDAADWGHAALQR